MYLHTTIAEYADFGNVTDITQTTASLLEVPPGEVVNSLDDEKHKVFVVRDITVTVSQFEPLDSMGMCEFKIWKE